MCEMKYQAVKGYRRLKWIFNSVRSIKLIIS
jgi:hypothetical protein